MNGESRFVPTAEDMAPVTPGDTVAAALADILSSVRELDRFEILSRWDDAVRDGPFAAVTAREGGGAPGEDGSVFAPLVEWEVSLYAAQGEEIAGAEWSGARKAVADILAAPSALADALTPYLPATSVCIFSGEEAGADGSSYVSVFRGRVQFARWQRQE